MRRNLHLDISEIAALRPDGLGGKDCDETIRHLLRCAECRSLLPLPDPKEFWNCVLGEDNRDARPDDSRSLKLRHIFPVGSIFGGLAGIPRAFRSAAIAAVLLLAIVGFSILFLFPKTSPTNESVVASINKWSEVPNAGLPQNEEGPESDREATIVGETLVRIANSPNSYPKNKQNGSSVARNGQTRKLNLPSRSRKDLLPYSETRGSTKPCGELTSIGMNFHATELGVRLSWEKVPGATSYAAYLSDLDERLIDQFETDNETSYQSTSKLDPETTYKWKLIVSLRSGSTTLITSRNFRIGELKTHPDRFGRNRLQKRTTGSVRCAEEK